MERDVGESGQVGSAASADLAAMVERIVEHHLAIPPKQITPLTGGLNNGVFEVDHEGQKPIVRIAAAQAGMATYLKEQWAATAARKVGVPAPEILEVGNEIVERPYMIMGHVEGTIGLEARDREKVLGAMGRLAAKVHSIATQGFGHTFDWSRNTLSRNATWAEFVHAELDLGHRLEALRRWRLLREDGIQRIERAVTDLSQSTATGALNHGDLRLKNVLIDDDDEITGLIDWEHSVSAVPPSWDLAIALHDLSIDEKQAFCEGYGLTSAEVRKLAPFLKAFNILNYVPFIERAASGDDEETFDRFRTRLAGAYDLYSI
ncbi:MAG: phosphotransferase [Hyphomicrobiales bacterium]|nr:phosphotransferase [Hyphomicrobiales bacterium]